VEKEITVKKIRLLDKQTASKIAAGEVIERPAGVLKELIENSLDAGADTINIDIEKAGKKLIRVNDNGRGIAEEDLSQAILRHTTSKIKTFEDLDNLNTFGFRGEALYSVSAISKTIITSCEEGGQGNKIEVEAGKIISQTKAPSIKGTTVEVKDLFFNTPARLKFLKSDTVERSHLLAAAEEAAMANPLVSFNVKTDNTKVYSLPARQEDETGLRKRLAKILGEDFAENLIYVEDSAYGFKAFLSSADKLTAVRDNLFFFINKRPVNCKILQQAVYKAYQPYRTKDKYPTIVLFMTLPADEFDVNIHPQKRDIKFINESAVFNFLYKKISEAVLEQSDTEQINLPQNTVTPTPKKEPFFTPGILSDILNENIENKPRLFQARDFEEHKNYPVAPAPIEQKISYPQNKAESPKPDPAWWVPPYNYLGQIHKSYLVFENPKGLVLVDQHAAQERVFFEEYLKSLENENTQKQPLMFPVNVEMPASEIESILTWREILDKAGFEISRFSPRTLLINTVPNILKFEDKNLKDFVISLSSVIGDPSKSTDSLKYKLISTMACKKSVKAGENLEKTQADALILNLKKCEDGLHCPHGRPTVITLDIKEITKKFGRT
jgi:DNA mismatch repair protein MutL